MDYGEIAKRANQEYWAAQHPQETEKLLEWLHKLQPAPKFVVEIGMLHGGNMWALQQIFPDAQFIGIDTNVTKFHRVDLFKWGTIIIVGSSLHPPIIDMVRKMYVPEETVIFFDGVHKWKYVMAESKVYPAAWHIYHDIMDDKKEWRVAKMYQDHKDEFVSAFSAESHHGGIGVRPGMFAPGEGPKSE